ncbi:hypothetical protein Acr_05g0009180 [Actinidia rufa]|uniref:Retrotransposon gag domain-containing protein n=1 Tax=Actinidia rufa TaxID=165716 RepID=A0A7J0EMR7_9ERIC|nr:hypothetical protein Acr_05g0009180 [Actinidia rufa]
MASSKQRVSPHRACSRVDLRETLNAKQNQECDLREKLNNRTTTMQVKTIIPARSIACAVVSVQRELVLEKFVPPRFILYNGKSNSRSHIGHVRQMVALWNHMDALMYRVFSSNLGDVGLKWFDKLPAGSIESFHQLTESFVARFYYKHESIERGWLSLDAEEG